MKKTILIVALLISGFVFETATAQIYLAPNKTNIIVQPVWGPVGYDYVEYYYMPDIDVFYYVPKHQYIYQQQGSWMFATVLPARFKNYDLYSGYKVVINDRKPYLNAASYRTKYATYKGRNDQGIIRNSSDSKYFVNKNHPEHNKWKSKNNRKRHNQ